MSRTYYNNVFDLFNEFFNDASFLLREANPQPARFNKQVSSQSFPPTNILINQDTKVLEIQAALAGIGKDSINLSFDGDKLKLVIDVPNKVDDSDEPTNNYYLQRGLKSVEHLETSWNIDVRFFDVNSTKVDFTNGLLTITIPPREDLKPKKVNLFGGLKIEDKKKLEIKDNKEE